MNNDNKSPDQIDSEDVELEIQTVKSLKTNLKGGTSRPQGSGWFCTWCCIDVGSDSVSPDQSIE